MDRLLRSLRIAVGAIFAIGSITASNSAALSADLWDQPIQPPEIVAGLRGQWNLDESSAESVIEFCATNVCDIFRFPTGEDKSAVFEFIFLYFVFVHTSNLPWIEEFGTTEPAERIGGVLDKHSGGCPKNADFVPCVLTELARVHGIQLAFSRYDEMARHEVPLDLSEQLDRIYPDRLPIFGPSR